MTVKYPRPLQLLVNEVIAGCEFVDSDQPPVPPIPVLIITFQSGTRLVSCTTASHPADLPGCIGLSVSEIADAAGEVVVRLDGDHTFKMWVGKPPETFSSCITVFFAEPNNFIVEVGSEHEYM